MAIIKPFRAIRPDREAARDVAALPYDVYSREEAADFVKNRPLSFLNIDRPETQFSAEEDMYADKVYRKAAEMLQEWRKKKLFIQDSEPCYYLYELTMNERSQTGIVALSSIDDYLNGVCRKHENTVEEKEQDRIRHVDVTNMQTGPIFLAFRQNETIQTICEAEKKKKTEYDFVSEDGIRHRVWVVNDEAVVAQLAQAFQNIDRTYIADGHHRTASAVKVGLKRRKSHPNYTGNEEFNFFLSVLFPDTELKIMDYNRVVSDLNGMKKEEFLEKLSDVFDVQKTDMGRPEKKGQMRMYLDGIWYQLETREEKKCIGSAVDRLDVSILQNEVLTPLLGICDPRTNRRISFVGGIKGIECLKARVDEQKEGVAFVMYPTSIQELFSVADAGLLMPPKSTWFEPKLRSGLFLHEIEADKP